MGTLGSLAFELHSTWRKKLAKLGGLRWWCWMHCLLPFQREVSVLHPQRALMGQAFNPMSSAAGCPCFKYTAGRVASDTWSKPLLQPHGPWGVRPHAVGKCCMSEEESGPERCLDIEHSWCRNRGEGCRSFRDSCCYLNPSISSYLCLVCRDIVFLDHSSLLLLSHCSYC